MSVHALYLARVCPSFAGFCRWRTPPARLAARAAPPAARAAPPGSLLWRQCSRVAAARDCGPTKRRVLEVFASRGDVRHRRTKPRDHSASWQVRVSAGAARQQSQSFWGCCFLTTPETINDFLHHCGSAPFLFFFSPHFLCQPSYGCCFLPRSFRKTKEAAGDVSEFNTYSKHTYTHTTLNPDVVLFDWTDIVWSNAFWGKAECRKITFWSLAVWMQNHLSFFIFPWQMRHDTRLTERAGCREGGWSERERREEMKESRNGFREGEKARRWKWSL